MPTVRVLLDDLAGSAGPVPDLGPAVLMDQLTVLVHDACAGGSAPSDDLAARLTAIRRQLAG